jgi:hypothetical protein
MRKQRLKSRRQIVSEKDVCYQRENSAEQPVTAEVRFESKPREDKTISVQERCEREIRQIDPANRWSFPSG